MLFLRRNNKRNLKQKSEKKFILKYFVKFKRIFNDKEQNQNDNLRY